MPSVIEAEKEYYSSKSALERLGTRLNSNANKLSWYLESNGYPQPSYELDTPINVLPSTAPDAVHLLRYKLKQDALELFRLASGPSEYVAHISLNHQYTVCLRYLSHFKILELVPATGSVSLNNIAVVRNLSLAQLTSVVTLAATSGFLTLPTPDRVAHSPASLLLKSSPEFAAWAKCVSHHMFDASGKLIQAHAQWGRSELPQHSGFNVAFDTDLPFGEYLAKAPSIGRDMGMFVKATHMIDGNDLRHLVNGFDWQSLGSATIVDVGSTSLYPCVALAKANPSFSFEIQPQPRAISEIHATLKEVAMDVQSRITISTQAMFEPQPKLMNNGVGHRRIYLLKHILHNLPDMPASSILRNVAQTIGNDDRIIIMDLVLPRIGELESYEEGMLRMRDMIQREMANGKTRDEDDWKQLIESSEPSLKLLNVSKPPGSDLSLLEVAKTT